MKRQRERKVEGCWCAPEHFKRGSSWKGDKLMTSNYISANRKGKRKYASNGKHYASEIPSRRLPDYVAEFERREGMLKTPSTVVVIREKNDASVYSCCHECKTNGNYLNDNHMNAVTTDGRKEYK